MSLLLDPVDQCTAHMLRLETTGAIQGAEASLDNKISDFRRRIEDAATPPYLIPVLREQITALEKVCGSLRATIATLHDVVERNLGISNALHGKHTLQ